MASFVVSNLITVDRLLGAGEIAVLAAADEFDIDTLAYDTDGEALNAYRVTTQCEDTDTGLPIPIVAGRL